MARQTQHERKADTRARLLDAAATLFASQGIDAVSVDAVADAADRTSGAVYAHFGSKHGLLLALLDEWKDSLVTTVMAELELVDDLVARLRAVARNIVVDPDDNTKRLLLLERELWLRAARDDEVADSLRRRARNAHEHLASGFRSWIAQGILPAGLDPATLASAFQAIVVGLETSQRVDEAVDVESATAALCAVVGVAYRSPAASGIR